MSLVDRIRPVAPPLAASSLMRRLGREPLLHFLLIGLVIFAADRWIGEARGKRDLVIDDAVYGNLVDIFAENRSRVPDGEEMTGLLERWMLNEVIYREAMDMGLDRGDEMIRERVMQKMRVMLQSGIVVDPPDEATARDWFSANRSLYDTPAVLSFRVARVDGEESEARDWARRLSQPGSDSVRGAPQIYPFERRPLPSVAEVFGHEFADRLQSLPRGTWTVVGSPAGWQVVQLEEFHPAEPARFEDVSNQVAADWSDDAFRRARSAAIKALADRYTIERMPYDPEAYTDRVAGQ